MLSALRMSMCLKGCLSAQIPAWSAEITLTLAACGDVIHDASVVRKGAESFGFVRLGG